MSGAPAGDLVFGVIRTLGGDRDGDILDPQDRATKALYHRLLGRRRTFFRTKKFHPLGCLQPNKSLKRKPYIRTRQHVPVLDSELVEASLIDTQLKESVRLLVEMDRSTCG